MYVCINKFNGKIKILLALYNPKKETKLHCDAHQVSGQYFFKDKTIFASTSELFFEENYFKKKNIIFWSFTCGSFWPLPLANCRSKHIYSVSSTSSKEVIECMNKYMEYYCRQFRLISDRGSCFTSNNWIRKLYYWS